MTKRAVNKRRKNKINRSTGRKLFLAILAPLLSIGIWYVSNLAIYYYLPYVNTHFPNHARTFYLVVSGLLYSGMVPALVIPFWTWRKLLFGEKLNWWKWHPLLTTLLLMVPIFIYFYQGAEREVDKLPRVISHRALDNKNAAENTIQALELTSKKKPDLVEIDIYETADLNFVVFHDATLAGKAKIHKIPHQLTLDQLTQITFSDTASGHDGKICSFDEMLDRADQLGVKLLVEIKSAKEDQPDMVERFLKKYQSRLESGHHQIQSSDASVMRKVVKLAPKLETFLISNQVLKDDIPGLTGYSVPLLQLTDEMYSYFVINNLKIYAWTVNDVEGVMTSEYLEVDAIITDYLDQTKNELKTIQKDRDYSFLYFKQLYNLFIFPMV